MIAVVYSGSRYADWKLAEKGKVICNFKTTGINPFFNDEKDITQLLNKNNLLINYAEQIKRIYFFGAGVSSEDRKKRISNAFTTFFKYSKIVVDHDLQGAALATCQDHEGIVGIIGSGSNAAYFDGKKYRLNNFGLGYVLGDEGSANWLGKQLLKLYLNEALPSPINEKFKRKYDLDRKQILDKIYRQPQPALFLSSFADFLMDNKNDSFVKQLVQQGFNEYIKTYIVPLTKQSDHIPIHIVGTIAFGFQEWLFEVAENHQYKITSVIKEPINNLLNYYLNKN